MEFFKSFIEKPGSIFAVGAFAVFLWWYLWYFIRRHADVGIERKFKHHLFLLILGLLGILFTILLLPDTEWVKILVGLYGIGLSGIIAFSSTTILANLAAGLLIRINNPFKTGHWIRIGEYFGKVTERGLFETEIQTEHSELIALPNTFCISQPVTTIRSSGTVISAALSLGYDVHHHQVEVLLKKAAQKTGLKKTFVHILELGNDAISYRIGGLLEDTTKPITARSLLHGSVLDTFHLHGIEILSPMFMNQKPLDQAYTSIPQTQDWSYRKQPFHAVEDFAFDKADKTERMEELKHKMLQEIENLEEARSQSTDHDDKAILDKKIELKRKGLVKIDKVIESIRTE